MPNRILKESVCTSDSIDSLSLFTETFFYRLIVNCDDFGRMDARPRILASKLFPLKEIEPDVVNSALKELVNANLIDVYMVDERPYLQMKTWDKHQQVRARKSKYPQPSDINCNQMISIDSKCPRNPIQSNPNPNPNPNRNRNPKETLDIDDDDAHFIQSEQNRVLDAAEDAGFMMSNDVRSAMISLYADHGLEKMLNAMRSCVEHGAVNLAYLRAVLKGEPKKEASKQSVRKMNADNFEQRDYSDVPGGMLDGLAAEMAEFMRSGKVDM